MTLIELVNLFKATGYPVAFSHFNGTPSVPFITYTTPDTDNFLADNMAYVKIINVDIELYTNKKDLEAEQRIEALLDAAEIPWDAYQTYIDSEKLFQKVYEIGVI